MRAWLGLASRALLADAAGCLLAEGGVLGPQPGDLLVCGVQAGAQRFGAGVWLWLAWANGRGRDWARVLAAAAFLTLTLSLLLTLAQDAVAFAPADVAAAAVEWALGLASVVLVFTPASCRYFRPPAAGARR